MSDSYKVYASKDYVDSKGLPEGQGAYQQLVTDANGVAKWEDRLAYSETLLSVQSPGGAYAWYKVSDEPLTGIEDVDMGAAIAVWLNGERGQSSIVLKQDDFIAVSELLVVAVLRDDCTIELNGVKFGHFPKRGMYFIANVDVAVTAVAIDKNATEPDISWDKNTETIKPIDPKYIPKETIATITHNSYNYYTIVEGEGASREQICNAIDRGQLAFLRCNDWIGLLSYTHQIEGDGTDYPNGTFAFFTGVVKDGSVDNEPQCKTLVMMIADENGNIPNDDFIARYNSKWILTGHIPAANSGVIAYSYDRENEVFGVDWADVPDHLPTTVPVIQSAQVGQTIVVKAVDENGKPTEWECADVIIPSSTEGSAKRFKLTVDDSGTITATEVTE